MLRHLYIFVTIPLLLLSGSFATLTGQHLILKASAGEQPLIERYAVSVRQPDSLSIIQALSRCVSSLQKDGYFQADASVPVQTDSNRWESSVSIGPRYEWAYLSPGNLETIMQEKSGFRNRFFLNSPFRYQDIQKLMDRVLEAAENDGFPFASVRLTDVQIENRQVQAEVDYQPGPYITFGPLQIEGTDKVRADFLATQLMIPVGSAYSQKKVDQIPAVIRSLPYLNLNGGVEVSFQNDEAEVHLSLSDVRSSEVDALVNFLPNENEPGTLLLTGRASLLLDNLMRSGKQLSLQWQRLQLESQQLSISYHHPFLFKTPLQADLSFRLLKEDTLFLNRKFAFSLSLPLVNRSMVGLRTELTSSSRLGEVVPGNESSKTQIADLDILNTGFFWRYNRLDDILYPTRGYSLSGTLAVGRKLIASQVGEDEKSAIWQPWATFSLDQYHRIGQLWVLHHSLSAAYLRSELMFLNELFRVGGLNSLRGFNDNFFFASYYAVSNLEWRLLLEQSKNAQSYLYVFYDQAILGHSFPENKYRDIPSGVGAGLSFSTRAGIFNLVYALGRTRTSPFNPSLSRIHFGYTSRF